MIDLRLEKDVFGFEITMDEASFFQHRESIQKLSHENLDELRTQPLELILLDQFVEVGR